MIDLCLINPPHPYQIEPNAQAALGLMYIASAAMKDGYSVKIINGSHLSVEETIGELPVAAVYGITGTSLDSKTINALASRIYLIEPLSVVLVGGPVTLGDEFLTKNWIDTIVHGEVEESISEILHNAIHRGEVLRHWECAPVDINAIAPPARHLWPGKLGGTIFQHGPYFGDESTILVTGRGCSYQRCSFCASPKMHHGKARLRNVDAVVEEMEQVVFDFNVRNFRLSDENLTGFRKHALDFCQAILDSRILTDADGYAEIAWRASIRATPNDRELFRTMHAAGCKEVSIGLESADPEVLRINQKGIRPKDVDVAIRNAHQVGLRTRALLMVGLPGETQKTFELNKAFLERQEYDTVTVTMFAPYPGCEIRDNPEKFGCEILNLDPTTYNFYAIGKEGFRDIQPFIRPLDGDFDLFAENARKIRQLAHDLQT